MSTNNDVTRIDLRVVHLLANYGMDAPAIAREHIRRYQDAKDWRKEQEWLSIYSEIVSLADTHQFQY